MIRRKRRTGNTEGSYQIQERYGLWLCKDYIPIQKKNEWIVNKGSEFTKFHAFFNCQHFKLTANRGSVENTTPEIYQDIESIVRSFYNEITNSDDYSLLDWLEDEIEGERTKEKEKKEFEIRKKFILKQSVATYKGFTFIEPQRESGVYSLVLQLMMIEKDLFPFEIIDYNTHTGIDIIVRENSNHSLDKTQFYYVEFKNNLENKFNHSFSFLNSIICWDTKLKHGEEVTDISKSTRVFKISMPETDGDYTRYFLDDDRNARKIEVFVLKDYLKEKYNIEFRPRPTKI